MARARSADPVQQFKFQVVIEGIGGIGFSTVSGLESEIEVAEYREGGFERTHKLPGIENTGEVTLERGATKDNQTFEWFKEAVDGDPRRVVNIIERDHAHNAVKTYTLYNAWASRFTAGELDATSSEVALEAVELQFEQIEVESA